MTTFYVLLTLWYVCGTVALLLTPSGFAHETAFGTLLLFMICIVLGPISLFVLWAARR